MEPVISTVDFSLTTSSSSTTITTTQIWWCVHCTVSCKRKCGVRIKRWSKIRIFSGAYEQRRYFNLPSVVQSWHFPEAIFVAYFGYAWECIQEHSYLNRMHIHIGSFYIVDMYDFHCRTPSQIWFNSGWQNKMILELFPKLFSYLLMQCLETGLFKFKWMWV